MAQPKDNPLGLSMKPLARGPLATFGMYRYPTSGVKLDMEVLALSLTDFMPSDYGGPPSVQRFRWREDGEGRQFGPAQRRPMPMG